MGTYSNLHTNHHYRAALGNIDSVLSEVDIRVISEPLLSVGDIKTIGHAASIMRELRFNPTRNPSVPG